MQSYPWLQVSARGEVTAVLTGEKYLLRDIDDPVEFFLAKRNEQAGFDLIDAPAPYAHVAADTTNNCNLRCPFCIDDFTFATHDRMTKDDFLKLTSMGELVWDGGLWLSCLFEPFLHPDFFRFLELVPPLGKQKCMLTTNLAVKRFKPEAVEAVAAANLNYINISVDSMTRDTYEKLRVNADYDVFWANLENLAGTFQRAPAP